MSDKHTEAFVSEIPKCDFCEKKAEYDGKTVLGAWGYMCALHFGMYGTGLGLGVGQKLTTEIEPTVTLPPDMGSPGNRTISVREFNRRMKRYSGFRAKYSHLAPKRKKSSSSRGGIKGLKK